MTLALVAVFYNEMVLLVLDTSLIALLLKCPSFNEMRPLWQIFVDATFKLFMLKDYQGNKKKKLGHQKIFCLFLKEGISS